MKIGYARVSTIDQNLDLQLDALKKYGCKKIYADKKSGKDLDRTEFKKMTEQLREGDQVIVWKLDRLSRSLIDLIKTIEDFKSKNVSFVSLNEKIDTSSPSGKLIFHIFSSLSEFEKDIIRDRTKAGLKAARARGRIGGRPEKLDSKQVQQLKKLYDERNIEIKDLCAMFKISRPSLYRYIKA